MEKSTNMIGAMFIGATVGAIAALLFSPRTGAENRQKLKEATEVTKDKVRRGKEGFHEAMHQAKQEGHDLKQNVAESGKRVVDSAKSKVPELKLPAA